METVLAFNRPHWLGVIGKKLKAFWGRWSAIDELADCDPSEVARIATDLGVSATELRFLAASDKTAADLLRRRLQDLRIDPNSIDPAVMRDLQLHCAQCKSKKLCAHELEDKPSEAVWPKYCPNEQTIEAITSNPEQPITNRAAWPR